MTENAPCPKCSSSIPIGAGFCPSCGAALRAPQRYAEHKYFSDDQITVTNTRIIRGGSTYSLANLASCHLVNVPQFSPVLGFLMVLIFGGLSTLIIWGGIADPEHNKMDPMVVLICGIFLALTLGGLVAMFRQKRRNVVVTTNAGQTATLLTGPIEVTDKVFKAIQTAMAEKS